jgi:hypothetical protein
MDNSGLLFSILIGLFAGLRSLTAPAVTAWAVHLDRLRIDRPLSLIGSTPSVAIFTVLAILELVAGRGDDTSGPGGESAPMDTPRLRLASSNALGAPRTPAPNRRLLLVISHRLPPDALDREWETAESVYPPGSCK